MVPGHKDSAQDLFQQTTTKEDPYFEKKEI